MQKVGPTVVFSPTDLNNFLSCPYLTRLDLEAIGGRVVEKQRGAGADLLAARGEEHERAYLTRLRSNGQRVEEIPDPASGLGWDDSAELTRRAMHAGADVIYQAVLLSEGWRGRADFLIRVGVPSRLGPWSYEPWDTKLARHPTPAHVLQLSYYAEEVAAIQELVPEWIHIVLGPGDELKFRTPEFVSYFRAVRQGFVRSVRDPHNVAPYPIAQCALCGYGEHCRTLWEADDDLCLVADIRRSQVDRLSEGGIRTCAALAAAAAPPAGVNAAVFERVRQQARLQIHFRTTGEHRYELLPPTEENGLRLMPAPSEGDVFFDMEGFPYFEPAGGLEYLFGAVTLDRGRTTFTAFRATDRAGEKAAFEQFIDFVWERLRRHPDLHVYHYAQYEPTALKRLMTLHATREEQVDELLRREVFVDLFRVVRRAVRISHDNYSIKAVRQFFMPEAGKGAVTGGGESIVEYQKYLDTHDNGILEAIERYNEEDCVSTYELRQWLLRLREEAETASGVSIPFCAAPERRGLPVEVEPDFNADLRGRLDAVAEPWAALLARLLDYHRREAKPEWWAYFERRKKSLDDLLDDTEAIAYLTPNGSAPVRDKKSWIHTLRFPPQEFKIKADSRVEGPLGEGAAGTIESVDAARGLLGLRRGPRFEGSPLPTAVLAAGPVPDKAQRAAIVRVAESLLVDATRYRAVQDILRRDRPRFVKTRAGSIQTLSLDRQTELVADLDDSYLFIQGPPGSGKTWTGARMIVTLIAAGKRVGVTAQSHRAIRNLLEEVEIVAAGKAIVFDGLKKRSTSDDTAYDGRFVHSVRSNEECEGSNASLIAGTAWLFAREGMDDALDYLFVDEAGQFALADAVAVGAAARNIVLLGDPQQLPHVTQNTHPGGSGDSVLGHLLGEAPTVAEDRGLFLASSWRMHPDICRFVSDASYEGRLSSAPGCELQKVSSEGLAGTGLRYIAVDHTNNSQESPKEAAAIAAEIERLVAGGSVVDTKGRVAPLTASDILVIAPYNMQVRCLRERLPDAVEVGTVDKFQGRQAAVVFYSMSSSSGDDVPRGLEFLFDLNRFNVAVSRAKCLSVVVCSPLLLEARCTTVGQMPLVNALCRFVEAAAPAGL